MKKMFGVKKVNRGRATGEAVVFFGSFSFLGDVDLSSAEVIAAHSPNLGISIRNKILIFRETKGSSGGMVVLMTLVKKGLAPAGIVTVKPVDYNLAEGAILCGVPFACQPDGDILSAVKTGSVVRLDNDAGTLELLD